MFKRKGKVSKLDFITPTVFIPMTNITEAFVVFKNSLCDALERAKQYIYGANLLRKDLYTSNMNLANYHLQNQNFFDAKFRFHVARFIRKKSVHPLLGLSEISIIEKNQKKAALYLHKALNVTQDDAQKKHIQSIIDAL